MKLYIAGKVSKDSSFGTHYWRDDFCKKLEELSGVKIENLDPTRNGSQYSDPELLFGADTDLIKQADAVVVYLSDDISVGGSQEILIAKYFAKPVIGLAPKGGKFNGSRKEHFGKLVENYKDPFVFATCDVVCDDIEQVSRTLASVEKIKPKTIKIIDEYRQQFLDGK